MARWRTLAAAFASLALACSAMAPATAPSFAQQGPTEEELVNALRPFLSRGRSSTEPLPGSVEEQRFIDRIRTDRTRQLTLDTPSGDTPSSSGIAIDRPKIDLEINFDYNSADISKKSLPSVQALGNALTNPDLKGSTFVVAGHTDAVGSEKYTQDLSERQADAVKRFLVENFDIPKENLVTVGYGKTKLKNPGNPLAAENRRIEIVNMSGRCQRGPSSAPFC